MAETKESIGLLNDIEKEAIIKAGIRGVFSGGVSASRVRKKVVMPLCQQFAEELEQARILEGLLELMIQGKITITGLRDGELTYGSWPMNGKKANG